MRFSQQLPQGFERLGDNPRVGHDRHEAIVARPPRHKVPMQMTRHARPGHVAQIEPNVEPLGPQPLADWQIEDTES